MRPSSTLSIAITASLAAAVAAAGVAVASGPGVTATGARSQTLRLVSHDTGNGFVDNAPRGDSAGDMAVFTQDLFRHGRRYGRGDVQFVETAKGATQAQDTMLISGAFRLPRGEITATGATHVGARRFKLAITGGTGAYRAARGSVTAINRPYGGVSVVHLIGVRP
jgi:hypothetical protein